jgi:hypothetical protein
LPVLHINSSIYGFSKFKFKVQFLSWVLFEVESFEVGSLLFFEVQIRSSISKLDPFRSLALFKVESFEVQSFEVGSFEVGSFEVGSYEVGSFEVQSFEVQSVNRFFGGYCRQAC